jgi:gluconate kinase
MKMTAFNQEELLGNWPYRCADSDVGLFCAAEKAARRDTLLEHWPKRKSSMTFASFDSEEVDVASVRNKRHHHHLRSSIFQRHLSFVNMKESPSIYFEA